MTCGDDIGNAAKYNRRLCESKGLEYMGTAQIVMPENYLAMFEVPGKQEAEEIIRRAEPVIDRAGYLIGQRQPFPNPSSSFLGRIKSDIVNPAFYALCVKAKAFRSTDSCVGCGSCVSLCPMNNIRLEGARPVWGKACTHCMACICRCPKAAIEYGKKSVGKPRYHFITGVFGELEQGKVVQKGVYAKMARGDMARCMAEIGAEAPEQHRTFD